ncbi:MAG: hypothetical protein V3W44_10105 [Dehalococcoidales bacterium]
MATITVKRTQKRYNRRGVFDRLPRSKKLLAWLASQATALGSTATGTTFVTVAQQATGTLTMTATPANTETITIDGKVYTFQTALTDVDGNVLIGGSGSATLDNLIAAINLDSGAGSTYAASMTLHPTVSAVKATSTTMTATAKLAGTDGNSIATTDGSAVASWATSTLLGGVTSDNMTASSHGISDGEGPYLLTTTDTLPTGLELATFYWVSFVDTNTLALRINSASGAIVEATTEGSGVHTLTKEASTNEGIFEILRRNDPTTIEAATDVDDLA